MATDREEHSVRLNLGPCYCMPQLRMLYVGALFCAFRQAYFFMPFCTVLGTLKFPFALVWFYINSYLCSIVQGGLIVQVCGESLPTPGNDHIPRDLAK